MILFLHTDWYLGTYMMYGSIFMVHGRGVGTMRGIKQISSVVTDRRIIPIAKSSQKKFYINKLNEARENVARRKQKGLKIVCEFNNLKRIKGSKINV